LIRLWFFAIPHWTAEAMLLVSDGHSATVIVAIDDFMPKLFDENNYVVAGKKQN
jgi:hypothetical protein